MTINALPVSDTPNHTRRGDLGQRKLTDTDTKIWSDYKAIVLGQ
jgi:hypothetical protein